MSQIPVRPCHDDRSDPDGVVSDFLEVRPRLLGIACRILGNRSEAEDIVQEAWLRWQTCDRSAVRSPTAFLVTTTTRLAINAAQSARARREAPVGPALPEADGPEDDVAEEAALTDALSDALLRVLQRLGPVERGAYVLRKGFDYPYDRIARLLEISEANARQHVSRAGRHLATAPRTAPAPGEHRRLVHAFEAAARHGDVVLLEEVLVTDRTPALAAS